MTNDEADERYGWVNIAESDSMLRWNKIIGHHNTPDWMVDIALKKWVMK